MPNSALDQIDLTILAALQRDGRLQNVDLADIAGLSSSPCLRRVKRLERAGFILRYSAVVERSKLGFGITALLNILVEQNRKAQIDQLREQLRKIPAVIACHIITGEADLLLEVVAEDLEAYSAIVLDLTKLPGIKHIRTSLSLETIKASAPLPIALPAASRKTSTRRPAAKKRIGKLPAEARSA
jgi:Lrp/AsnC family leucine-responsive transcriptional regulator